MMTPILPGADAIFMVRRVSFFFVESREFSAFSPLKAGGSQGSRILKDGIRLKLHFSAVLSN